MKLSELMIGDFVSITEPDDFNGYVGKVVNINGETGYITVHISDMHTHDVLCDDLQPIKLSDEILNENGFEKRNLNVNGIKWGCYELGYNLYLIHENGAYTLGKLHFDYLNAENTLVNFVSINHVHELQHLMNDLHLQQKDIVV